MNFLKSSFLLLALLFIASCGEDDDQPVVCGQSDWVGTYTGTVDCDGLTLAATASITASGADNLIVSYVSIDTTGSVTTSFDPLPFDGCNLDATASGGGDTVTLDADLNGDELTLNLNTTTASGTTMCRLIATRN